MENSDDETWTVPTWQDIEASWHGIKLIRRVHLAFQAYTGLEGLKDAYYLGVESRNCEGAIPNEFPKDDPKYKAFNAGYKLGLEIWGSNEP